MQSIADLLRREIKHSGETLSAIAKATGIHQPPLWRFVNERTDLMLDSIEKLLDYFGYVVVKKSDRPATGTENATSRAKTRRR